MRKNTVKKFTSLALTLAVAASLMGCGGNDKKNEYVDALNTLSGKISAAEDESLQVTSAFGNNPTNEHLRDEYAAALEELAKLYLELGELPVIEEVQAEHDAMVAAAETVAGIYTGMVEVMRDDEVDFGTRDGVMELVGVADKSDEVVAALSDSMNTLVDTLNE